MGAIEVFLIMAGIVIIAASFCIRERKEDGADKGQSSDDFKSVTQDMIKEEVQNQLAMMSDDVLEDAEAKLDKIANQKIMAVGNYSEDVLKNIEDNHNEVMFLYNMLNDKETTLKNTVRDIEAVKVSVKKMADDIDVQDEVPVETGRKEEEASQETAVEEEEKLREEKEKNQESGTEEKNGNEEKVGNKELILGLYRQGKTNVEIAQELNLGVGEVNLVLGLFK